MRIIPLNDQNYWDTLEQFIKNQQLAVHPSDIDNDHNVVWGELLDTDTLLRRIKFISDPCQVDAFKTVHGDRAGPSGDPFDLLISNYELSLAVHLDDNESLFITFQHGFDSYFQQDLIQLCFSKQLVTNAQNGILMPKDKVNDDTTGIAVTIDTVGAIGVNVVSAEKCTDKHIFFKWSHLWELYADHDIGHTIDVWLY